MTVGPAAVTLSTAQLNEDQLIQVAAMLFAAAGLPSAVPPVRLSGPVRVFILRVARAALEQCEARWAALDGLEAQLSDTADAAQHGEGPC